MSSDYQALCADFYINQRLDLKMDLPSERETLLNMFDRVKKQFPAMRRFRRASAELLLESESEGGHQMSISMRRTSIRTSVWNPPSPKDAYTLHKAALELAPYFLTVSPLDIAYLELMYGFDLLSSGNHDQIVYDALYANSPLSAMMGVKGSTLMDCQPVLGVSIPEGDGEIQAFFQIRTRPPAGRPRANAKQEWSPEKEKDGEKGEVPPEPLSVYLTMRKEGPVDDVAELPGMLKMLASHGEKLLESKVIPNLILPIRDAIAANP